MNELEKALRYIHKNRNKKDLRSFTARHKTGTVFAEAQGYEEIELRYTILDKEKNEVTITVTGNVSGALTMLKSLGVEPDSIEI